jgi:hypothetical protein
MEFCCGKKKLAVQYAYLRYLFAELPKAETVEAIEALLPGNVNPEQIKL